MYQAQWCHLVALPVKMCSNFNIKCGHVLTTYLYLGNVPVVSRYWLRCSAQRTQKDRIRQLENYKCKLGGASQNFEIHLH